MEEKIQYLIPGKWFYVQSCDQLCQLVTTHSVWNITTCRLWNPNTNQILLAGVDDLHPMADSTYCTADHICYAAAAARVSDSMENDMLLAPIDSQVIPLPHQLRVLSRAITDGRVRYLLADEVGLGKTVEAGLILRELKLRGLVKRTLVVALKGLVTQWIGEMRNHFGETFQLILPEDLRTIKRLCSGENRDGSNTETSQAAGHDHNPWKTFAQVVVPLDSVKPLDKRSGWSSNQVDEYNYDRFKSLIAADWDLIIVDEAHRLGGTNEQVARFKLGLGLSKAAPYLLLLSATPHQGKTDAFHRLMSLLDSRAFADIGSITRDQVQPYVIRTEKRRAIDAAGQPLFKPRRTQLVPVSWKERHSDQKELYEAVSEYVRHGYNRAIREKRTYIGFLMLLMQRLAVSSTSAIRTTLEKRLHSIEAPDLQLQTQLPLAEDEWEDLDGQEQIDTLLNTRIDVYQNESSEIRVLLDLAARCAQSGPDVKAEALLNWLYRLRAEENDPELKVLVFTEFIPTQAMLQQFLRERSFSVTCLNGSMSMDERVRVQRAFAHEKQILISTDAGGEGLNLQFSHVVINYDIPWNPMRIEQRIGRVDRIGQTLPVRAINIMLEETVEYRVQEVLEQKLAVIYEDFGIDKTGDVLDSAAAGHLFDEMYITAITNPNKIDDCVNKVVSELRDNVVHASEADELLGGSDALDPREAQRLLAHPLPHWIERMTTCFLRVHGGRAEKNGNIWRLTWPDGTVYSAVVFTSKEAEHAHRARQLTLSDDRVCVLATKLPMFACGQPIPVASISGMHTKITGLWGLWNISVISQEARRSRVFALFVTDDGEVFAPTAKHIWDQLLVSDVTIQSLQSEKSSQQEYLRLHNVAESTAKSIYEDLARESVARTGHRADYLAYPELTPITILRIENNFDE